MKTAIARVVGLAFIAMGVVNGLEMGLNEGPSM